MRHGSVLLAVTVMALATLAPPADVAADVAVDPKTDYARLQRWQFAQPVPIPAGGITITRDTATWTLQSGTVRHMEPLAEDRKSVV